MDDQSVKEDQMTATATTEAPVALDFAGMKVKELDAFMTENAGAIEEKGGIPGYAKMKAGEKRAHLKVMFAPADDLESGAVTGFDPTTDPIHQVILEVEGLKDEAAAVEAVVRASDDAQFSNFRMGGILARMLARQWFTGYDDFYLFAQTTFGLRQRKAQALMQLYRKLVEIKAIWPEIEGIGWTKIVTIVPQLTEENKAGWFIRAGKESLATLIETVKMANAEGKGGKGGKGAQLPSSTPVKKLTIKIHEDTEEIIQAALEKARNEADTKFDGPALHFMSVRFLNDGQVPVAVAAAETTPKAEAGESPELEADEETLTALFQAVREALGDEGLSLIFDSLTSVYESLHVEVYPDGKPE